MEDRLQMETRPVMRKWIVLLVISVLLLTSLACGTTSTSTQQSPEENQGQTGPTKTAAPTKTPKPTSTPTPAPVGLSRSNPFPGTDVVSVPNWDVQIMEIKRGDAAWTDIQAANMFNEAAPEGMEYLLLRIHVKSTYADSEEHSIGGCDFDVTGDNLINYTCGISSVVEPDPQLDATLFSGGESEGWVAFLVGQGETNLILVVDETMNFDSDAKRYIAIDEGASVSVSSDLAGIDPTDSGKDRNAPVSMSEKVITEDWELSVIEVIRGDEAWTMVQEANQFNDPPLDGFEYIAVKLHLRYIGTKDEATYVDNSYFKTTGSAGILHDSPFVVVPDPALDASLYPGGECEGWIVVQASKGETNVSLIFEPLFDFGDGNKRFILIEP